MKGEMVCGIGLVVWGGWEAGAVRWDKVGVCLDDVSIWRSIRWNQVSWVRDAIE